MSSNEPIRCPWCSNDEVYKAYHDNEWGVPSYDDQHLFEMLILETFQAGLSWLTILKKRENFRKAFDNFNINKISKYGEEEIGRLMEDAGIIRYRLKITGAISNANVYLEVQKEFGSFSNYMWGFVNHQTIVNTIKSSKDYPVTSKESDAFSKDLKKRGFKFVGSTTIYAHMQSIGMVNDHSEDCWKKHQ
ncbi:MAG: DNA-3-methyladenine glycosylase I [Bacteroidia bacterium]|nr:DNA-3-methyladenine glycosylase I [Bacteroidia bacterium]